MDQEMGDGMKGWEGTREREEGREGGGGSKGRRREGEKGEHLQRFLCDQVKIRVDPFKFCA